jgi:hypothetical protein
MSTSTLSRLEQKTLGLDFLTLEPETVRAIPSPRFLKMSDILEDWNHHTENTVFLALRAGTENDIREAREILVGHHYAKELTPELSRRRHALLSKLSGLDIDPQPLPPPAPVTVTIPLDLLQRLTSACLGLGSAAPGWTMPPEGPSCYQKLGFEALAATYPKS